MPTTRPDLATTTLTCCMALLAFAANSVLCRLALGSELIDAGSFTVIRLLSGAIVLGLIVLFKQRKNSISSHGSWKGAFYLFAYAACFSFAYRYLDTASGALILFASVQLTMLGISLLQRNRFNRYEWCGILMALSGLVYLLLPSATTPAWQGFLLMAVAGVAWGGYSLLGRGSSNPLADTCSNFVRTIPLCLPLIIWALSDLSANFSASSEGVMYAVLSGAVASGIGYSIWYTALRGLSATVASVSQLSVPIIAALGGVIFVGESLSLQLLIASVLTLGGVGLVIMAKKLVPPSGR
ncbi:MAG: DMT family transporter [Motiliproteus sp.]|nr:DMT family transporter [Motiliproteus sp.]